jgi:DNA-binding SARP family transcriptional activator
VSSGSLNLQIALWIRAFPAMLPLLAGAIGVDSLPTRLLALLTADTAGKAMNVAPAIMGDAGLRALSSRLSAVVVPSEGKCVVQESTLAPSCYIRLFGGLNVTTESGVIEDSSWRKRKARALLIMLALQRGQDLSREVIFERLWPDLEYQNARNNFYVMWSTLRRTLARGATPEHASAYIRNTGGLCRITQQVTSDLDGFDAACSRLRVASENANTEQVLLAARQLVEIYRGDLLPGDVYDDWLAEPRSVFRQDFCSAMLRAGQYFESLCDYETALEFLRKAGAVDPWREDVYQAIMRCNMYCGRRSGAIETFLICRSKLSEDLGIDPSAETMRLYEAVLAMDGESGVDYTTDNSPGSSQIEVTSG